MAYTCEKIQPSSIEDMIRTETISMALKAMETLPAATRKVFQLHFIEGKTYDEIANELGKSKNNHPQTKATGFDTIKRQTASNAYPSYSFY
jgi:RNA polymerase sigma factor (sigma-70 family)